MKKIIFYLLVLFVFSSCEMVVNVDIPPHKSGLVINSVIDPSENFIIHVSSSLGSLDNAPLKNIDNATVEIYEDGKLLEILTPSTEGNYFSDSKMPVVGREYKMIVNASPFETVTSRASIPFQVPVSNIVLKDSVMNSDIYGLLSSINFLIPDPPNGKNYYMVNLYRLDLLNEFLSPVSIFSNDPAIEASEQSSSLVFSDDFFDGKVYPMEVLFNTPYYEDGMSPTEPIVYIFSFSTLSKEYFDYKVSLGKHLATSFNPFAEPVQVFTNIENGLGIFAGKNAAYYTVEK